MYRRSHEDWEPRGRSHAHNQSRGRSRSRHRIGGLLAGVSLAAFLARRVAGCLDRDGGRDGGGYTRREYGGCDRGYEYGYGSFDRDYDRRRGSRGAQSSWRDSEWDGRRDGGWSRSQGRRPAERERDRSWERRRDRSSRDSWGYEPRRSASRSSARSSTSRKPEKRVHWAV